MTFPSPRFRNSCATNARQNTSADSQNDGKSRCHATAIARELICAAAKPRQIASPFRLPRCDSPLPSGDKAA